MQSKLAFFLYQLTVPGRGWIQQARSKQMFVVEELVATVQQCATRQPQQLNPTNLS